MGTTWTDEIECSACGVKGQHLWSEGGHMDSVERTVALQGDFDELPRAKGLGDRQAIGAIVCRRCGGERKVLSHRLGRPSAPKIERPPDLPWRAVAVLVDDRVELRLYHGGRLTAAVPLGWRQAMLLGAQLTEHALMAERADAPMLKRPNQDRVA